MPLDSLEFRTSLQRLLVGLILILVPLTVFGFYVALQGDSYVRQMNGDHFRTLTRISAEVTSRFVGEFVKDVPGSRGRCTGEEKELNGIRC